ncbi:MAG: tetratricopeptide repeat protein, partial [Candidatus Saccharimonas sp.]|nr:tetratricopeptide repeat protein [Planctomycetaceae bacterium]
MHRPWSWVCCSLVAALSAETRIVAAQEATAAAQGEADSLRGEDARELAIVERFVAVLEKSPRRGTALDKVYAFHVERGSLDSTIAAYREKVDKGIGGQGDKGKEKEAAAIWMIVGLLESLRGEDAVALKAFENAERFDAANSLASYYLGQTLVLVGQSDKAVEAFERAVQRQPARTDLLEVFQSLGRVHQRTARSDKALDVWNRLEQQFPNDERVQEQIATTLLDEEAFDAALPRFEKLAQSARDRSRQLGFRMEAADIRVRLGQTDAALKEFESLLTQLNPDHWVYREVRRRIEAIYLRTEDRAGLAAYYETWLAKHPEDMDAIARVAKVFAAIGRDASAREWLERGLKLAPSRRELRRTLIDHLIERDKFAEATAHYEQLDKHEPNNPDTLRDWGRSLLKDRSRDETERRQDAARVWRRLIAAKPQDPLVASQIGDLFRHADMIDEALEQYRRAIDLAPEATQYREYLGEYLHTLQRKDEALAMWRPMAEDARKTAPNVARLGEVLASFGYVDEAIANYAEAVRLDPKDFGLQLKHVDLLMRAERHEEAIRQLATVESLIANDEEREAWLQRDLRALQAAGKLKERI